MLSGVCRRSGTKGLKKNYKRFTIFFAETLAKWFQKSYNMVTARAQAQLSVKSFSSCFRDIGHRFSSSDCSPSQFVILRAAQAVSRFVCKKARPFWTSFFASSVSSKWLSAQESMTLPRFGGQFACFSAKDIYKVWRGRGLYSGCLCGKVYSINLYTANMKFVLCFCCFRF